MDYPRIRIGITKERRKLGDKYARRFHLFNHRVIKHRLKGTNYYYLLAEDRNGLLYKIRFDKILAMRRPDGHQVINKLYYFIFQAEELYGDKYDYSLITEEDIGYKNKLTIVCPIHGEFKKRKASHITDGEGCPMCAADRFKSNRQYYKNEEN